MALILKNAPQNEPLDLEEVKTCLRVDHAEDDTLIRGLITSARLTLESILQQGFVTQSWSWLLDDWPQGTVFELPLRPARGIEAIVLSDENGSSQTVDIGLFYFVFADWSRLVVKPGRQLPAPRRDSAGVRIDFTVGYGSTGSNTPAPLLEALRQLILYWYENKESDALYGQDPIPQTVERLITPYRRVRL